MRVNRLGAPSSLKSANTATGSVADMREPKSSATVSGILIPKSAAPKCNQSPIRIAETIRETTASAEIVFALRSTSWYFIL